MESYSRIRSVKLKRSNTDEPFGFSVRGGHEHGTGLFVSSVEPRSLAHKARLKVGDQILRINSYPVSMAIHNECLALMRFRTSLHLKVRSVGMIPVREKMVDPLTWKLVEEPPLPPVEELSSSIHHHKTNGGSRDQRQSSQHHHHSRHSAGSDSSSHIDTRLDSHGSETKVFIDTSGHSGLGCCICKGPPEKPGIFVQSTKSNGVARFSGLRPGDQILQCNGHSFLHVPFSEAVFHLKISKHLNLVVRKGAASDLFPGESSGYNSSASSLNGDTQISSISSNSNPTENLSGEIEHFVEHHHHHNNNNNNPHRHRRLPLVSEERRLSSKGSSGSETDGIALDRHIEWNEVEESWREAEKERLVIQVRGENNNNSLEETGSVMTTSTSTAATTGKATINHNGIPPSSSSSSSVPPPPRVVLEEEKRLLEERKKLLEDQRRLIEEAVQFEEEKRQFEEEKRKLALLKMNQPPVIPAAPRHISVDSSETARTNPPPPPEIMSRSEKQNTLAGALHKELMKRVERRENGVSSTENNANPNGKTEDEKPKPGTVNQKISLFANTADVEKRQQHEQLIKEFKRAHRKMFAHSLEQLETVASGVDDKGERKFIGAKRIQKEVEHERKMVQQQVAGIVRQRQLRIERQYQETEETEKEVRQAKNAFRSSKSPPPPPPVNEVDVKSSSGGSNSKWTTLSIKLPAGSAGSTSSSVEFTNSTEKSENPGNSASGINKSMDSVYSSRKSSTNRSSSSVTVLPEEIEIPESPSPDYSNSPSPIPGSGANAGDQWEERVSANGKLFSRSGNTKFGFPPTTKENVQYQTNNNKDVHPNGLVQKYHQSSGSAMNQESSSHTKNSKDGEITTSGNGKVTIILGGESNQAYNGNNNNNTRMTKSTGGILKMANSMSNSNNHNDQHVNNGTTTTTQKTISFGEF